MGYIEDKNKLKMCLLLMLIVFVIPHVECYNLSPKPNRVFKEPQLFTYQPKVESSYFGYSLNLRPRGVIVGAPRAQSNLESQRDINETGVIYRCPLNDSPCYPYVFDDKPNTIAPHSEISYNSEKRDFQWLGGAMDGGTKDEDKVIVCAPRFIAPAINEYLMHGRCYWVENTIEDQPTNVKIIAPLRGYKEQLKDKYNAGNLTRYYYYMLAEEGLSAHISENNEEMLVGAPGVHTWKGSIIRYSQITQMEDPSLSKRDTRAMRITRQAEKIYSSDVPDPDNWEQPNDSYFGYAVSSGYFDSNDATKLMYVATAPQADLQSGEAYIFEFRGYTSITKRYVLRGTQFGEYFGYSVLAVDLNGDGLTDVIVSAPQYSISGFNEDGAIYVFTNIGRMNFERKLLVSPALGKARFGTTLTKLGDINHDGYQDIAVGAPFAGNGSVFIYLGSDKGLRSLHSQRLDAPTLSESIYGDHMFGHGLSKGADIDNNGFNDFAVGAPNADTVYLYRAYPVVKILTSINLPIREVSPDLKKISVSVCYGIATTSPRVTVQDVKMKVVMDPKVKRLKILQTQSSEVNFVAPAQTTQQCRVLDCEIRFSAADIFKPIEFELHYELKNSVPDSEEFCEDCVAVDPAEPKFVTEKISFITGCASTTCIADLKIKSSGVTHTYILGTNRIMSVTYDIINNGEFAYLPQINITSSNRMPFSKIPINCNLDSDVLVCNLNQGHPLGKGKKDSITVGYDVSKLQGKHMVLTAEVFSSGQESNSGDNIVKDVITLKKFTEVEVVGQFITPHINLEKTTSKTEQIHNFYEIKSLGPSDIDTLDITFNIPIAYKVPGAENKIIQIVDLNNIMMEAVYDTQDVNIEYYQNNTQLLMGSIETSKSSSISTEYKESYDGPNQIYYEKTSHTYEKSSSDSRKADYVLPTSINRRRRRDLVASTATKEEYARIAHYKAHDLLGENLKGKLPVNRTIVFNCNDPEMTSCIKAIMRVPFFRPENPLTITMKYNVDLQEVTTILSDPWEFFVIIVDVELSRVGDAVGSTLMMNRKIQYNIISKHQLLEIEWWIIILAIIIGIIVLAVATYVLYKFGFFKRSKKEEMAKLVQQKSDGNAETDNLNTSDS